MKTDFDYLIESAEEMGKLGVFSPALLALLELWITKARALRDTDEDAYHRLTNETIDNLGGSPGGD